ncbi:unnamed protein product, partial [Choristocarpus tenellus]
PSWISHVRGELGNSPAWEVLSNNLYHRIEMILKSHGLGHFSDLQSAEQVALLEEAQREMMLAGSDVYRAFEVQFSKIMDTEIAKEARRMILHEGIGHKADEADEALYLERILDIAAEGAVCLLQDLPREHMGSLRLMLNQPIPMRSRLELWKLLLSHTVVRGEYNLSMKQNQNLTISGHDVQITHRCQSLLESGRIAESNILPISSRNVILMKTVLSYHHACRMSQPGLKQTDEYKKIPESYLHFMIPLCAVMETASPTAQPKLQEKNMGEKIADLIEMFEAALDAGLKSLVDQSEMLTDRKHQRVGGHEGLEGLRYEDDEDKELPWVEVAFQALLPSLPSLLNHIGQVHAGLTNSCMDDKDHRMGDGDNTGEDEKGQEDIDSSHGHKIEQNDLGNEEYGVQVEERHGKGDSKQSSQPMSHESTQGNNKEDGTENDRKTRGTRSSQFNAGAARRGLKALLSPLVTVSLVGYLRKDSLMFVWDQAVMGGFGAMVPRVAAMIVASIGSELMMCSSEARMALTLHTHSPTVTVSQLQELMERHCLVSVRQELKVGEGLAPEIVGPDLKTATNILEQAYSFHTRGFQKVR